MIDLLKKEGVSLFVGHQEEEATAVVVVDTNSR